LSATRPTGTPDIFGPLIGANAVRRTVLNLLRDYPANGGTAPLFVYYLAEVERQNSLAPQTLGQPGTYRGGTDWTVWDDDDLPAIIVTAKPIGAPEYLDQSVVSQWLQVQLAAIVKRETEAEARMMADCYGIALAGAILQNRGLGPNPYDPSQRLAVETELTDYPDADFAVDATTSREIMRSVVTFRTLIAPVLTAWNGPTQYATDAYAAPGNWGEITEVNTDLVAIPPID
jgi:hypothetical protein